MLKNNDVPAMMSRVSVALAKGARARPSRPVVFVSDSTMDEIGIGALRPQSRLQIEFHSGSHRRAIGPTVRFGKRAVRRALRWYLAPIAQQQSLINNGLLDVDQRLLAEHEKLVTEVSQLRDASDRLEKLIDAVQADVIEAVGRAGDGAASDPEAVDLLRSSQRLLKYSAFEDRHRGSEAQLRQLLTPYVVHFENCVRVLDVGCGRGEFLQLLKEAGVSAYGVDSDESMVESARQRGVEAVLADAVAHLRSLPPGSVDGIFCSQVAEHLTTNQLLQLIELSYRKLAPGGVVVMETPNPETLSILAFFFYVDLTHVKPIHPEALKWAHEAAGFTDVLIERSSPVPEGTRLEPVPAQPGAESPEWAMVSRNVERLNKLLYGPQHYAIVARRPEEIS